MIIAPSSVTAIRRGIVIALQLRLQHQAYGGRFRTLHDQLDRASRRLTFSHSAFEQESFQSSRITAGG